MEACRRACGCGEARVLLRLDGWQERSPSHRLAWWQRSSFLFRLTWGMESFDRKAVACAQSVCRVVLKAGNLPLDQFVSVFSFEVGCEAPVKVSSSERIFRAKSGS